MSDLQTVEGADAQDTGFGDDWDQLRQAERTGQAERSPDSSLPGSESDQDDKLDGQGGDAAPPSEAAPGAEPAPGEAIADIWADAPEALRTAFQATEAARVKAEEAARTASGRASKAQRDAAELRARLQAPPPAQAPGQQEPEVDPEHRQRLLGEYEDIVAPVADELLQLRQEVARLSASSASAAEQTAARDRLELAEFLNAEEGKLAKAHSDWGEVVSGKEFVDWVTNGPAFIRDGIARNANGITDAAEAIAILDLYKASTGQTAVDDPLVVKRRRQLGAAAIPARVPAGGPTAAKVPDDYDAAWEALRLKDVAAGRAKKT